MYRRRLLAGCSSVLAGVLAGCGGGGSSGGETSTQTPSSEGDDTPETTPTPSPTPTDTPTPTETATPPATDTPTPSGFTHEVDEEFTVGEGKNAIGYRIVDFFRTDRIGSSVNVERADDTFLIVVLELRNPGNSSVSLPRDDFRVQTTNSWSKFERAATQKVGSDERLNVDPIGDATVSPGKSKLGAVVFDVDPDMSYRIWITPSGGADTPEHFVPIGNISSVEELQDSLTS